MWTDIRQIVKLSALTMSSREIADLCAKEHRNVLRDIRSMLDELYPVNGLAQVGAHPHSPRFEFSYTNEQNGQTYPEFLLPKRETLILVSGYSLELRTRIIDRWQQLEMRAAGIPSTLPDALRLAADLAEETAVAKAALELAAPKAAALDLLSTETEGAVCLRVAAKLLQMPERQFLRYANARGFIFRGSHNTWQSYSEKLKAGLLEQKLAKVKRADGSERVVEQVLVTRAGLARLAEMLAKDQRQPL